MNTNGFLALLSAYTGKEYVVKIEQSEKELITLERKGNGAVSESKYRYRGQVYLVTSRTNENGKSLYEAIRSIALSKANAQ